MAFDAYIQIAEIAGEAKDEQYSNWIEILGYTFGSSQSASATAVPQAAPLPGVPP